MAEFSTDDQTTLQQLRRQMATFVAQRDWEKFHRPKNLAMSLAIEAAELMEHFQWLTHAEAAELLHDPAARQEVADEMSDVLAFLLSLANAAQIDLSASFQRKMLKNERKYPPQEVRGQYRRPPRAHEDGSGRREARGDAIADSSAEQRFIALEEKLAFAEKTISDLDEVIRETNKRLAAMRKELDSVTERLNAVEGQ